MLSSKHVSSNAVSPHGFQPGNKLARGGVRPGSGRKKNEVIESFRFLESDPIVWERFVKILHDHPGAETKVTDQGVEVPIRARADTYLFAFKLMLEYSRGKAVSMIEMALLEQKPGTPSQSLENAKRAMELLKEISSNASAS